MPKITEICEFLENFAPTSLAEEWDNVGLLIGDRAGDGGKIMTCLTVTPVSAREAIKRGAQLIVTHHPFPFRAIQRMTRDTTEGAMLLDLISAGVAVYSPHTAFDSAATGINHQLAVGLKLKNVAPLVEKPGAVDVGRQDIEPLGAGRHGALDVPVTLAEVLQRLKTFLDLPLVKFVGDPAQQVRHVAIACGSAGEFLGTAQAVGADCFITGETNFHTCLAAEACGTAMVLTGHFASERFAVVELSKILAQRFPDADVWASQDERDPITYG